MKYKSQKLSNEDIRHVVRDVVDYGQNSRYLAKQYGISQRRVQQLSKIYRETGNIPMLKRSGRKPYADYPEYIVPLIIVIHLRYGVGASLIGKILRSRYGLKMDNNYINDILKLRGMAMSDPKKHRRKKPWIRYERQHSLSAVHMDWTLDSSSGLWACAVLDDASRKVLGMVETPHATAEASVELLDRAYRKYQYLRPIQSVIVDHGSQFYANKRDKKGNAKHPFEQYCKSKGIKLILCKYNHPQSNGKIERFFQIYKKHRYKHATLDDFVYWYNNIRPHMSLNFEMLETPEQAFRSRISDLVFRDFWNYAEKQLEVRANDKK